MKGQIVDVEKLTSGLMTEIRAGYSIKIEVLKTGEKRKFNIIDYYKNNGLRKELKEILKDIKKDNLEIEIKGGCYYA